jgi:hypothetical protein
VGALPRGQFTQFIALSKGEVIGSYGVKVDNFLGGVLLAGVEEILCLDDARV